MTKFDSVSTLLADYTGRKIAAAADNNNNNNDNDEVAGMSSAPSKIRRRAATAAPTGGGATLRTGKKRSRNNNASDTAGGNPEGSGGRGVTTASASLDRNTIYPSGKLEEDKNPSLFGASAAGGGRKMVSLMTAVGKKLGGGGGGGVKRRAKTAGKATNGPQAEERGGSLTGLAIRDLTPPGFLPPKTAPSGDDTGATTAAPGEITDAAAGPSTAQNAGIAGVEGQAREGEATEQADAQKIKEVCFNCWSKGSGKTCTLHSGGAAGNGGTAGGGGPGKDHGQTRVAESALMCKNWDVGVMRRRYRSEELQVREYEHTVSEKLPRNA